LLKTLFNRLPDVDMELDELIRTEGARRIQAGEMTYEQAMCFVEALRLSNEETGKLIARPNYSPRLPAAWSRAKRVSARHEKGNAGSRSPSRSAGPCCRWD